MKAQITLKLCVLLIIPIFIASCKGKSGSGSTSDSSATTTSTTNSTTAASSKGNSVMDSLNITDPDEKKICALYDDVITDYLTNLKTLATDTTKAAAAKRADLDQKYKAREKEIQPQVEAWRRKVAMNPTEAIKFSQFSLYESKRVMGAASAYTQGMLKNLPTSAPNH